MHDLSLNLFYKTEFDIQTVDPRAMLYGSS